MTKIMWAVDKDFSGAAAVVSLPHWNTDITLHQKSCEQGLGTPVRRDVRILMKQEMSEGLL